MNSVRRQARQAALQILYFWEIGKVPAESAIEAFFAEHLPEANDTVVGFATALVHGTAAEVAELDQLIDQHSAHWRVERLAVVDRLILRMAIWEFRHEAETPAPVVLNEAMELARLFSTEEAVKFINGVLEGVRKALTA